MAKPGESEDDIDEDEFQECEECRVKPGSPTLCGLCLKRRSQHDEKKQHARIAASQSAGPLPMYMTEQPEGPTHLSHFMHLVSAYVNHKDNVTNLAKLLRLAKIEAHETKKSIIVDQDVVDFFFLVHPNGIVSLCARLRSYALTLES